MSLKESALKTIETGAWTFDDLAPRFRSALIGRIRNAQEGQMDSLMARPLMEITLRAYDSRVTREWPGIEREPKFVNRTDAPIDNAVQGWIADKVSAGGIPSSFSTSEIELLLNAESFLRAKAPDTSRLRERWVPSYMKLANVGFRSGSHPHAFGCIFFGDRISEFSVPDVATSIVHEMAHQELFLFNLLDRLVETEADFKLVHAPFQGIKRPTIGRLHSLYALFRMVEFQRAADLSSSRYSGLLLATAETFEPNDLTEYGHRLVSAVVNRSKVVAAVGNAVNL